MAPQSRSFGSEASSVVCGSSSQLTLSAYTRPVPESQRQLAAKVTAKLLPVAPKSGPEGGAAGALIQ
jgi:hypothetical protein